PFHRQGLPRAVRDADPQAGRGHPRPQPPGGRCADAPEPSGRGLHRDQVIEEMSKGLIARKLGMTQLFNPDGTVSAVTVLEAGPCRVVGLRTVEKDGYAAAQIGFGEIEAKRVTKPVAGGFKKAGVD